MQTNHVSNNMALICQIMIVQTIDCKYRRWYATFLFYSLSQIFYYSINWRCLNCCRDRHIMLVVAVDIEWHDELASANRSHQVSKNVQCTSYTLQNWVIIWNGLFTVKNIRFVSLQSIAGKRDTIISGLKTFIGKKPNWHDYWRQRSRRTNSLCRRTSHRHIIGRQVRRCFDMCISVLLFNNMSLYRCV